MFQVAIDGPCGAGKTTTAKALADELGFLYVDTGALYRAIGLHMLRSKKSFSDVPNVLETIAVDFRAGEGGQDQRVYLGDEDVTSQIRTQEVAKMASDVSAIPAVRGFLLDKQRDLAKTHNVVMEGRDIGSVILPNAQVKFYLTATLDARAQRRFFDEQACGRYANLEVLTRALALRDENDMSRAEAPLMRVADAILVDNTNLDLHETVAAMLTIIRCRLYGLV